MGQGSPLQIGVVARIRNIGDVPVEPKTSQEFLQLGTSPQRPSFGIDTADSSLFLSPVFSCRNVTLHCIADATSKASLAVHVDMAGSVRIHLRRTYMRSSERASCRLYRCPDERPSRSSLQLTCAMLKVRHSKAHAKFEKCCP